MEKCNHGVIFLENEEVVYSGVKKISRYITAKCPSCGETINEEQIGEVLLLTFNKEIADQIFKAFKCRNDYLQIINELSRKGVSSIIFKETVNNE